MATKKPSIDEQYAKIIAGIQKSWSEPLEEDDGKKYPKTAPEFMGANPYDDDHIPDADEWDTPANQKKKESRKDWATK